MPISLVELNKHMKTKDTYIMGRKPIMDALQSDQYIERVWLDKNVRGEVEKDLRYHCRQKKVHLQAVPKQKLNTLVKSSNHQGVVALISPIQYYELEDVLQQGYELGKQSRFIALDGIEDTRNLGAIARTALWFGADALIVPNKGTAGIHAGTIKSSAGALLNIKVCRAVELKHSIQFLKDSGVTIIGADGSGTTLREIKVPEQPFVIVMGNEEKGISNAVRAKCDIIASIHGTEAIDSLNVGVAAGILMHHFM